MDSKHKNSFGFKISTVATMFTMWLSVVQDKLSRATVLDTTASKFILGIYTFLVVALIYLVFVPFTGNRIWLTPAFLAFVAYGAYRKTRGMLLKPVTAQMYIHAQCWVAWTHTMALIRWWEHVSYRAYFSETLFDVITLSSASGCRGSVYGVLWYYAVCGLYAAHAVYAYWAYSYKVHIVPTVKKYQMLPPPKIKKK